MSTAAPIPPHDSLGLELPYSEHHDEADRYEGTAAWGETEGSPFAEALAIEGASQEESGAMSVGEEERLAWLDLETEGEGFETAGASLSFEDETFDEDEHEHEHEHEHEDTHEQAQGEYLDDEERDAGERDAGEADESWQEQFDTEAPPVSSAPLGAEQRAWVLALDRSAIERLGDASKRASFLAQDWSDIEFPGNVPKGQSANASIRQHWSLARSLFDAMANVVPERRVPSSIRFIERPAVKVPGQSPHRLFAEARDAFGRMHAAAKADGVDLVILSSWRSRARQAAASANQPNPNAVARKASAHMYGLAIDVRMGVAGLPIKEINTRVDRATAAKAGTSAKMGNLVRMYRSPVYKWLSLRAREFGWYPYRNEPWHWEYNPPGLKSRFEGATRGELELEAAGEALDTAYEQDFEGSPYTEALQEDEASNAFLRTFTAKALGVKVAVYVTQAARNASDIEMMVFAHGLDLCKPVSKNRPATFISEAPFKLGALVEASGRPIVLVVPFLDWERLTPNGMAYGRKWHRLARPETFNQVAAEALEQARGIANRASVQTLRRLILAGHSRAYGFFDALAHEHASPHMRAGALSRPTVVWALDTTYSAPIADWRAWLRSRDDLQATVVFRQGRYQTKGSTVVRELATGIRGREFAKLAAASGGRLTAMPVAAGKVSHCAIPMAYLPTLLAALPPLAAQGNEAEFLDEAFDAFEDEAGLAAEAEAQYAEDSEAPTDPPSPIVIDDYPRYGKAMPPEHRRALQPLVTKVLDTVKADGRVRISIVGHADFDAQGREFETQVSVERATVAQQTLVAMLMSQAELAGITPEKLLAALDLTIQGMGTKQPQEPNPVNEPQRRKNRRVEFFWEASGQKKKRPIPPPPPPDVPVELRLVGAGVWTRRTTVKVRGEQMVRFVVKNENLLTTSIVITDTKNGGKQSRSLLPGQTAVIEFSMLRPGVSEWEFDVGTNSQTCVVSWQAFSFMPQPQEHESDESGQAGFAMDMQALSEDAHEQLDGEWNEHDEGEDEGESAPDRFDSFGDARDSEWQTESSEELDESSDEADHAQSFAPEQEDEGGLSGSGLTPAEQKAVEITSLFETGKRGGFYALSGNFDGQGLSFGLVNWTIGTGSLQPLLREFAKEHPARWVAVFGADASRFLQLIARKDKAAQAEQHRFAVQEMNTVSTNARGKRIWTVRQPWVGYFKRLSEDAAFQGIQVRYVRDLLARAEFYCQQFKLRSEQAFCFMFDAVASHGKWWIRKKFDRVEKRRVLVEQALKALAARHGAGRIPEADVLLAIADVLATTSAQRWADKVRERKRWFVTGQHPRKRELEGLRPRADAAYTTSSARAVRQPSGEDEVASEDETPGDGQLILGKWTVWVQGWVWEYEFLPGGKVRWRDTRSLEKGEGRWTLTAKSVDMTWNGSTTTESWERPLTPARQAATFKSSYYNGPHRAQKIGGASAVVPAWADAIDPFPPAVSLPLDTANAAMNTAFGLNVSASTANHLCAALGDVTGRPASTPFAGLHEDEMVFVGSLLKVGAMYAAFALRSRVQAFADAARTNGITTAPELFALIKRAWSPKLRALFPARPTKSFGNGQDVTVPQVDRMFTLTPAGRIEFARASTAITNAQLDVAGEFGAPPGKFHEWMRLMMRWSNNTAASRCVLAVGYFYINGLFARAGFFAAGKGLWMSGDYAGHDWVATQTEKNANAAGVALSPRWATAQKRATSNFVANALQVGRLMTAMAVDTLADPASCDEMRTLANQMEMLLPLPPKTPRRGIGSYALGALATVGRTVTKLSSKIGFGDDSFSHDCAIVERVIGTRTLRYAAVVLGSAKGRDRRDLSDLFVLLDAIVVARNP